jgi:hypothetical protein
MCTVNEKCTKFYFVYAITIGCGIFCNGTPSYFPVLRVSQVYGHGSIEAPAFRPTPTLGCVWPVITTSGMRTHAHTTIMCADMYSEHAS